MPLRIRLAYHPLARKKEPLYHIVVAKSKTGRQRKPLEVLGVYDPIPRYPTTPTGRVLEDQDKIKKISLNVDKVKYWLSVGAQPTDHCVRLFAKANLIPPKPLPRDRVQPPTKRFASVTGDWGHANQGTIRPFSSSPSNPQPSTKNVTTPQSEQKIHKSIIAPSGEHIESGIRKQSIDLVSAVRQESLPNSHIAAPGKLNLYDPYAVASSQELESYFNQWCERFYHRKNKSKIHRRLSPKSMQFRLFMAYIQPLPHESDEHGIARSHFLREWMQSTSDEDFEKLENLTMFDMLSKLFRMWASCVTQLGVNGLWGEAEKPLKKDILQRAWLYGMLRRDLQHRELRETEGDAWNAAWAVGKAEMQGKRHRWVKDIRPLRGESEKPEVRNGSVESLATDTSSLPATIS